MHLKQIKLSGFKSFVEPTVIPFPSQLVAIVGPNGCGKSNIIDAVRWVMGEASAKNLRGESMVDVIFNGSSGRKPLGQASVELLFDNRLGRLGGQYASYQEIAIKRTVTRDGDSFYFLNGSRCRRRDITELFLGTGAGTRGYSIIGQNTISEFIEANPLELRQYFEEAAGISIYKERRKETLSRIEHTRENLLRVEDLRAEMAIQLQRLERQAKIAEQYKQLKQTERHLKGDMLLCKWRKLTETQEKNQLAILQLASISEGQKTEIAQIEEKEDSFDEQIQKNEEIRQQYTEQRYQIGTEVARLQELQQQYLREKKQLVEDEVQLQASLLILENELRFQQESVTQSTLMLQASESELQVMREKACMQKKQLQETQCNEKQHSDALHALLSLRSQSEHKAQVGELSLKHLQDRSEEGKRRFDTLQIEKTKFDTEALQTLVTRLREEEAQTRETYQNALEAHQRLQQQAFTLAEECALMDNHFRAAGDMLRTLTTEYMAKDAAQKAALSQIKKPTMSHPKYSLSARLVETLEIEESWRAVCEWILGEMLYAVVVQDESSFFQELSSLSGYTAAFIFTHDENSEISHSATLCEKFTQCPVKLIGPLTNIFTANTLDEALTLLKSMALHQSVVTKDGFWLGHGWVKVTNFMEQKEESILSRRQALSALHHRLETAKKHETDLKEKKDKLLSQKDEVERMLSESKVHCTQLQREHLEAQSLYQQKLHTLDQSTLRLQQFVEEQENIALQLEELAFEQENVVKQLKLDRSDLLSHEALIRSGEEQKQQLTSKLMIALEQESEISALLQQKEMQYHREQLNVQQLRDTIYRNQMQLEELRPKLVLTIERKNTLEASDVISEETLKEKVEKSRFVDEVILQANQTIMALREQEKEFKEKKASVVQKANVTAAKLVQLQMDERSFAVQASSLQESLSEWVTDVPERLLMLPVDRKVEKVERELHAIGEQIEQLGAVNLLAIEEYQLLLSRKAHLDMQSSDLNAAIAMLMEAIAKIDTETQSRLKETFEAVNELFQALFPRLFGGGSAKLMFTSDNLLDAGIVVKAQPPGKRNSTIYLLSGGEKALTAVALVFAIFQLNPSPFCLLDEVDAPLDDLNVGRFCDLVREMSCYVQFLLISHNKLTMELANHLIGVTMQEPGVSRIVTVDVERVLILKTEGKEGVK